MIVFILRGLRLAARRARDYIEGMRNGVQGVIFDVDGTLVDSNDAHAQSWLEVLQGYPQVTYERVRALIGKGGDKLLPELTGVDPEGEEGQRLQEARAALFKRRYLPALRPLPGARALVQHLHDQGLRLAVASSAQAEELQTLLQVAGVEALLTRVASSSDAEHSKPDPDIIHAALAQLRLPAAAVVMIGDTPYDIIAAQRAGVAIIALRCGGRWSDDDLRGADALYDSPADLLRQVDASPLRRA